MAGTTGLEPATSAVTVSQNPVTCWNNKQRMAPIRAIRHTKEPLLCPYCVLIFDSKSPRDLCRPAALVAFFGPFLCPVAAEVAEPKVPNLPKYGHKGTIVPTPVERPDPRERNGFLANFYSCPYLAKKIYTDWSLNCFNCLKLRSERVDDAW